MLTEDVYEVSVVVRQDNDVLASPKPRLSKCLDAVKRREYLRILEDEGCIVDRGWVIMISCSLVYSLFHRYVNLSCG